MAVYTEIPAKALAKVVETAWRSGRCIEVIVAPNDGQVASGSRTTVTATVKHKIDGTMLDKPVEANLAGGLHRSRYAQSAGPDHFLLCRRFVLRRLRDGDVEVGLKPWYR